MHIGYFTAHRADRLDGIVPVHNQQSGGDVARKRSLRQRVEEPPQVVGVGPASLEGNRRAHAVAP